MIKQNLKLFFKTKRVSIPVVILLLCCLGYHIYKLCYSFPLNGDVLVYLSSSLELCLLSFIILYYASYEFFYLFRYSHIDETLYSHKNGKFRTLISSITVFLFIPAIEFFIAFGFNIIIFILSGMSDYSYLFHIFSVLFLYVFFGGIIPILLGAIFAQKSKRIVSYASMALIVFLISDVSKFIFGSLSDSTKINFWEIKYFFAYILPNDLNWTVNYDYGMYAEIYRWNLTIFWIFLLLLLIFKLCYIKKTSLKVVTLLLTLLISTSNLIGYFYGGSHLEKGEGLDGNYMADYLFYSKNEPKIQEPNFEVKSYNMDLNIWRELKADISMTLSNKSLDYYNFTLYHGYKVSKITDIDGNDLKYSRDGDYITVNGNGNLQTIKIKYSGYSPILYSNSQACSLLGFFPYYPVPGFYEIRNEYFTYKPLEIKSKAEFNIKVDSARQIYSNLSEIDNRKNCFSGVTTSPTLISGFYKSNSSDNYEIYSETVNGYIANKLDAQYIDKIQSYIDKLDKSENKLQLEKYTIFGTDYTFPIYGVFLGDDTILMKPGDAKEVAEKLLLQRDIGYCNYVEQELTKDDQGNDDVTMAMLDMISAALDMMDKYQ